MAKLQVVYDASQEIESIYKCVEQHINLKHDEKDCFDMIQKVIQSAFDDGRRFHKQINVSANGKDSITNKLDI